MVKFSSNQNNLFKRNEQYSNCSNIMMIAGEKNNVCKKGRHFETLLFTIILPIADNPSLEELDPAILSCGLPAIILDQQSSFPRIRYTKSQLRAFSNSPLSKIRPAIIDDPIFGQFYFWKKDNVEIMNNRNTMKMRYNSREDINRKELESGKIIIFGGKLYTKFFPLRILGSH